MTKHKQYKIETLQDIRDKIPAEKHEAFLKDYGTIKTNRDVVCVWIFIGPDP